MAVAQLPQSEGHAARAATGLKQRGGTIREEPLDQDALGFPEAELVRGARVVDDGQQVVEVGPDGTGGDFFHRRGRRARGGLRVDISLRVLCDLCVSNSLSLPRGDEHAVGVDFLRPEEETRGQRGEVRGQKARN